MELLSDAIRVVAADYVKGQTQAGVIYGTVRSTDPLEVDINQKLKLTAAFLSVAQHLTDYDIPFEATAHISAPDENGRCELTDGVITLKNALKVGDRVILARLEGGQQYAVMDRVG